MKHIYKQIGGLRGVALGALEVVLAAIILGGMVLLVNVWK